MRPNFSVLLFLPLFLILPAASFCQGAALGTSGATPDPSAAFDIQSNSKGLLIPRLTTAEREAIESPAEGLQIFNTTTKCFEFYAYDMWFSGSCAICQIDAAGPISGVSSVCPDQTGVSYSVPALTGASSYVWSYSGSGANFSGTGNLVTVDFSGSATSGNLSVYGTGPCGSGQPSQNHAVTVSTVPSAPASGSHGTSATQINWNWSAISGATGYRRNTTNDYGSSVDLGSSTTYQQTGLTCENAYTMYVWAYNDCGYSSSTQLNASTSDCPCGVATVTFTYRGSSTTYGTVSGQGGTCWMDRNLGASNVATAYDDSGAYGDLFQWGRADDGHQDRSSGTTTSFSSSDTPGHSNFITSPTNPWDWRSPKNDALWHPATGTNDPCPAGWRVPTESQLNSERTSWSPNNYTGAFISPLKWTTTGYRTNAASGALDRVGTEGWYWAATISGTSGMGLNVTSSTSSMAQGGRAAGRAVRCIKE